MASPNVLFITVDQWRGDCLSSRGHPVVRTPNLDRLAAEGVLFANHFANSTPCGPSRAGIHTGTYQFRHRSVQNGTPLDDRFTTLPREVRALGRTPHLLGYTDTTVDPRAVAADDPRLRTYETVMDGWDAGTDITEHDPLWQRHLAALGYELPEDFWDLYAPVDVAGADEHGPTWAPTRIPAEHSETAFLTDSAIALLEAAEHPFFLHLSYLRPHPPYRAPAPYHDLYDEADIAPFIRHRTLEAEAAVHPFLQGVLSLDGVRAPLDERDCRQLVATYYGLMSQVDDELGRLFDHLRSTGRWDDTVVILSSDHGEQAGDHWLVQKLGWFDQSYHVPLIVHDPRHTEQHGTVVESFTENVDLMPTMLDLLGAPAIPLQCDGRSLVPFLRGEQPAEWRSYVFWEFDFRWVPDRVGDDLTVAVPGPAEDGSTRPAGPAGLRTAECAMDVIRGVDFKYVHFPTMPPLFYDLTTDPAELVDRSGDPEIAGRVLAATQLLVSHRMRHDERTLATTIVTSSGVHTVDDRLR
jgi:arylsulfatase A-like enzyme